LRPEHVLDHRHALLKLLVTNRSREVLDQFDSPVLVPTGPPAVWSPDTIDQIARIARPHEQNGGTKGGHHG